jgi:hypothetical protein
MERPCWKSAMFGLLDRATKLTSPTKENWWQKGTGGADEVIE